MITLFQIDKSGNDLFEKDYSIIVLVNKERVYGINIPQKVKDDIISQFNRGKLNILSTSEKTRKNRLRIRFHSSVIIKIVERAIKDIHNIGKVNIELCNDIDGHFHEIKDMLFKHLRKIIPNIQLEDIVLTKFQKLSLIDEAGKAFRNKDKNKLKNYMPINLNPEDLLNLIKK